ncbi:putative O-glycosylation ligase, exosortase A system-associated [Nitrosospira multiformis]|uniref:O-antigen polymerase n=1 Tax=Nitrosospira multiformis (strain ATCC 25196 / NCIMB 11849 / C 71) TaxID=323848 RepID=Q2YCB3_NITMU|nr:putative O-glycosylation ligase, exosortase A system-associated [Nitrosospira multiformis]ABB73608.1 O-antigen polymerase [Nitrosospira multiformis ATCC 25196]SDZ76962.1 probable O-glycosylation ligase, exosortase A-associated [Nitrosospira multiformis]SEF38916.1 probable O-glycosylation ligase, exosortase A-associated [Nitrosospira multiformis ATCC 25196]
MRDILVTLIVFGWLPFVFKKPYMGALMWVWISVMNPHTQGWGFATTFPFAAIIAGVTITSLLITKEPKNLPLTPVTWTFIIFVLWMNLSTVFAIYPDETYIQWNKVMKIMLMSFVVIMLIRTQKQIQLLIWTIVISLGYYGIKGGVFTLLGGGVDLVMGPESTFIEGNNEIALALIMTIPLMHYVQMISRKTWVKHAMTAAMLLSAFAALGSYSRGALLAIAAMGGFLWLKSQHKGRIALLVILAILPAIAYMPEQWMQRMDSINTYEEDASVQGRFNAWWMAYNLAKDRPLTGGGFDIISPELFFAYAPNPEDIHAAHSIYFQALGEHGFVGLGLYLLLGWLTWRTGSWIIRNTSKLDEYRWAFNLATMIQVSFIGFATGGAFLSLLYFDVPYYLMGAMVATRVLVEKELKQKTMSAIAAKTSGSSRQLGQLSPSQSQPIAGDSS